MIFEVSASRVIFMFCHTKDKPNRAESGKGSLMIEV